MYKNLERFVEWLKKVSKYEVDEQYIKATLEELDSQYCNTDFTVYELSSHETKSGNPETYSYNVECEENEDGDVIIICEF